MPISVDLDELGRIAVEVDHVAGFARGLRAGLHGDADVGLRKRRRVVGAVAAHGDQPALGLLRLDVGELVLWRRFGDEVVDACLGGDGRGGDRVVAGHHHGLMPMARSAAKRSLMSGFTTSLRWMTPSSAVAVGDGERRAAGARDARRPPRGRPVGVLIGAVPSDLQNRVHRALADAAAIDVDAGDARLRRERDERCAACRLHRAPAGRTPFGQRYDRAALRRLVGERGEQRGLGHVAIRNPGSGNERGRQAVAVGDRAGLVEQQRIDVAGRLDGAARGGDHVEADQPIHAGDADGRQQAADGRRDERDEKRDEDRHREHRAGIAGEPPQRRDGDQKDQRQAGEQDRERELVRRLLPLGALDQRDHPVEEGRARRRR